MTSDVFSGVTKLIELLLGSGTYTISTQLTPISRLGIRGTLAGSASAGTVIKASSGFTPDSSTFKHTSTSIESVLLGDIWLDRSDRDDGIWFNGIRSSMMRNVVVQNASRTGDFGFTVRDNGSGADASAHFLQGLRNLSCWGSLHMTGIDPCLTIDNFIFGIRLATTEKGIFLDSGAQSSSAVSRNGFWGVTIDTASTAATGTENSRAYNHFERVVIENTSASGTDHKDTVAGVYVNLTANGYAT